MSYAQHRKIIDADSHVIELDDFLIKAAREADIELLQKMDDQTELPIDRKKYDDGVKLFERRKHDATVKQECEDIIVSNNLGGWSRIGAFDPQERSHALDLFGYEKQWVLPTFSFHQVAHVGDMDALYAGARTLNKAMADFCTHDDRLLAIGYLPYTLGPERALELMKQGFDDGCYTFMIDTNEPNDDKLSFAHPDFDPVWAGFVEQRVPFGIHVAANGHYEAVPKSFKRNGKNTIALGGDAPAGELGLITIKNSAELFLSALIFDGVFDRHPSLRGMCMEHGAFWVPSWLKSLDFTYGAYVPRREFVEKPSDTARRCLKFSPFAGEPVGWIIENTSPDMICYASDYPHPEGGSDPISKFEATMEGCDEATMSKFYHGNMQALMSLA